MATRVFNSFISKFLLLASLWLANFVPKADAASLGDADFLFDTTRLVEISIDVDPGDWDSMRKQRRDMMQAMLDPNAKPFSYVKADITIDGKTIRGVGIRKKGFIGSLDDDFPSLKVKFNEFESKNPFQGIDRLTLNNNKQDPSLVSQFLTYRLFNQVGVKAPRVGFARVTVNGKYLGVYSNVESIEKPFLKARFEDDSGMLVEGALVDFSTKSLDRFETKSKSKDSNAPNPVNELAKLLDAPEIIQLRDIEKVVDVDEFLRYWCTESLIGFWDGYTCNQNNFFAYHNPKDNKLHFMPWGADAAWMGTAMPFGGFGGQSDAIYANSLLAFHLFQQESIPDRYCETMKAILRDHWNESEIESELARLEALLAPELHDRQKPMMKMSMEGVRNFVKNRRKAVDRTLAKPLKVPAKARNSMVTTDRGTITGKFMAKWNVKHKKGDPSNVESLVITIDGQSLELREVYVTANEMARPAFGFGPNMAAWVPPATISITGLRADNKRRATLNLNCEMALLSQAPAEIDVNGSFSDGESGGGGFGPFGGPGQISVRGKLKLKSAGTSDGDLVDGEISLQLLQVKGGFMDRG